MLSPSARTCSLLIVIDFGSKQRCATPNSTHVGVQRMQHATRDFTLHPTFIAALDCEISQHGLLLPPVCAHNCCPKGIDLHILRKHVHHGGYLVFHIVCCTCRMIDDAVPSYKASALRRPTRAKGDSPQVDAPECKRQPMHAKGDPQKANPQGDALARVTFAT